MIPLVTNLDLVTSRLLTGKNDVNSIDNSDLLPIPFPLFIAFKIVHISNFCFRLVQRHKSYLRQQNELEFVASNFLNLYTADRSILTYSAQCILITRTILNITQAQKRVSYAAKQFIECASSTYPIAFKIIIQERALKLSDLDHNPMDRFVTTFSSLPRPVFELTLRVQYVTWASFELISEFIALSLSIIELFEALVLDRITQYESVTGVFNNSREIYNYLSNNPNLIIEDLTRNELIINNILKLSNVPFNVEDMKSKIIKINNDTERVTTLVQPVLEAIIKSAQDVTLNLMYLATGSSFNSSVSSYRKLNLHPSFSVRSFDEHDSYAYSTCSARAWNISERLYASD